MIAIRSVINFIDYRIENLTMENKKAVELQACCESVYWLMVNATQSPRESIYKKVTQHCFVLYDLLRSVSPITAQSLREVIVFFENPIANPNPMLKSFIPWFGRGQQYQSFVKL